MHSEREDSGLRPRRLLQGGPQGGSWLGHLALPAPLRRVADRIGVWLERRRTRRRLTHLSDHMLHDIGVSRAELAREVEKPFWRK